VEILRATLPLPSVRTFFELFFSDDAVYSVLDPEAWQINGFIGKWTPGRRREMKFDVPTNAPSWATFAPSHAHIAQVHGYRFVSIDCNSRGEAVPPGKGERFEFTREIFSRNVPFQDEWYGQQLWTVEPVCESGEWCCMITITADVFYTGRPRLLVATIVTRKFLSDSKNIVEHWHEKARAVALSRSSSGHASLVGELKDSQSWLFNTGQGAKYKLRRVAFGCAGPYTIGMILLLLVVCLQDMVRTCAIQIGFLSGAHSFTQAMGYFGSGASSVVYIAVAYSFVALLLTGLWQAQVITESASRLRVAR